MRVSTGCRSCRFRRKRCDMEKPRCAGCRRNHLICAWSEDNPPQRPSETRLDHDEWNNLGRIVRREASRLSQMPTLRETQSQYLYSHFVHCTSDAVSIQDLSSNPFLQILLPLALHHDMIFEAILTLSGVHCLQKGHESYGPITWRHYAHALRQVKCGLTRVMETRRHLAAPLAICTLLFTFIELVRGDTDGNAFHHLGVTKYLLGAIPRLQLDPTGSQIYGFILEWYCYLLSLSTFSEIQSDDTTMNYSRSMFVELSQINASLSGVLCGFAHELFGLIPRVTVVAKQIHMERQVYGGISDATYSKKEYLLASVCRWQSASPEGDHTTAGKIYQLALMALLVSEHDGRHLPAIVDQLVPLLHSLPVQSNVTTTLCWPLGILGGFAQTSRVQTAIREYLLSMTDRYGFGNFKQTVSLLEAIWGKEVHAAQSGALTLQLMMETNGYYFILA